MKIDIGSLKDKVFEKVIHTGDGIHFETKDGEKYVMTHQQDCCESVDIEDINGDLEDLVGSPILLAEVVTNNDNPKVDPEYPEYIHESFTWTFYKLGTVKGTVTFRWYGSSNGYYSESVEIYKVE